MRLLRTNEIACCVSVSAAAGFDQVVRGASCLGGQRWSIHEENNRGMATCLQAGERVYSCL